MLVLVLEHKSRTKTHSLELILQLAEFALDIVGIMYIIFRDFDAATCALEDHVHKVHQCCRTILSILAQKLPDNILRVLSTRVYLSWNYSQ